MILPNARPWFYRTAALLVFIVAQVLVLLVPMKMHEPGDWGFQYAARNFSHGHITLTVDQYLEQSQEVWDAGGWLLSYANTGEGRWAFTPAPGYVLYLAPFESMRIPQVGASLLSLGLIAVLYLLIARIKDEKTALFGVILLVFTPLYLAMWQRVYMDALASLAFCGMGGGLYLYYWLSRDRLNKRMSALLLLASGLLLAVGVLVRYPNIAIVAVFIGHFLVMAVRFHLRREQFWPTGLFFGLGVALPLLGLLVYQGVVFGAPLNTGGEFAQLPVRFVWHHDWGMGYSIVRSNIAQLWAPLIIALPVILAAIPSFAAVAYGKFFPRRPDSWPEIPAHLYHLLWGWIAAVFMLYVMYEWTAYQQGGQMPFTILTRFYLPALLPLVIVTALMLQRLLPSVRGSILVLLTVLGVIFFIQVTMISVPFDGGAMPPSLNCPVWPNDAFAGSLKELGL